LIWAQNGKEGFALNAGKGGAVAFQFFQSVAKGEAKLDIPTMGLGLTVLLSQSVSGGALTVLETINAPGFGPPLHRHHETEVFRVLEGKYLYEVDGKRFYAAAGDLVSVPGGATHTFTNVSEGPSRQLVLMLPAMDAFRFFSGLGELVAAGRPDMAALNAYGSSWGVEFLGPPIHDASQSGTAGSR
jgi:quercetin dioxygenase-like cupin family protein